MAIRVWQVPVVLCLAALAVWVVGVRPALLLPFYLAGVTVELCRTDMAEHRLPNAIVVPGYGVALVGLVWQSFVDGAVPLVALAAGGGYLLFLLLLSLGGGMGMGDVKLAGLLGLALGALGVVPAITGPVLAFVFGGVAGLALMISPAGTALQRTPFGPFMLAGFWAAAGLSVYM